MKPFASQHCHCGGGSCSQPATENGVGKIILVGNPNVGKSVLFNCLTGQYATVSNYPGTTVEVTRGKARIGDKDFEVVDTPGMYSLVPISEEERVARNILFEEPSAAVVHVLDAKNLERMLPFSLQLIETGLPVILALNMMDEVRRIGGRIDLELLEEELGRPVVATAAVSGEGIDQLKERIKTYVLG